MGKPKGGARPGSGRKPSGLAKLPVTKKELEDIGMMAREYTSIALTALEKIARAGKSESAKVSAAAHLLDRGYGKPKQTVDGTFQGKVLVGWLSE